MFKQYKIEKDVPLAKTVGGTGMSRLASSMEANDSVVVPHKHVPSLRIALKRRGFDVVQAKVNENNIRVWALSCQVQ